MSIQEFTKFGYMDTDKGLPAHWFLASTRNRQTQLWWQTLCAQPWGAEWWNPSSECSQRLKPMWCATAVGLETISKCVAPGCNVTRYEHAGFSPRMKDLIKHPLNKNRYSEEQFPNGLTAAQLGDAVSLVAAEQFVTNLQIYWRRLGKDIHIPRTAGGSMFQCVYNSKQKLVQDAAASFLGLAKIPAFHKVTNIHTYSQIYEKSLFYLFDGCDLPANTWGIESKDCLELLFVTIAVQVYISIEMFGLS